MGSSNTLTAAADVSGNNDPNRGSQVSKRCSFSSAISSATMGWQWQLQEATNSYSSQSQRKSPQPKLPECYRVSEEAGGETECDYDQESESEGETESQAQNEGQSSWQQDDNSNWFQSRCKFDLGQRQGYDKSQNRMAPVIADVAVDASPPQSVTQIKQNQIKSINKNWQNAENQNHSSSTNRKRSVSVSRFVSKSSQYSTEGQAQGHHVQQSQFFNGVPDSRLAKHEIWSDVGRCTINQASQKQSEIHQQQIIFDEHEEQDPAQCSADQLELHFNNEPDFQFGQHFVHSHQAAQQMQFQQQYAMYNQQQQNQVRGLPFRRNQSFNGTGSAAAGGRRNKPNLRVNTSHGNYQHQHGNGLMYGNPYSQLSHQSGFNYGNPHRLSVDMMCIPPVIDESPVHMQQQFYNPGDSSQSSSSNPMSSQEWFGFHQKASNSNVGSPHGNLDECETQQPQQQADQDQSETQVQSGSYVDDQQNDEISKSEGQDFQYGQPQNFINFNPGSNRIRNAVLFNNHSQNTSLSRSSQTLIQPHQLGQQLQVPWPINPVSNHCRKSNTITRKSALDPDGVLPQRFTNASRPASQQWHQLQLQRQNHGQNQFNYGIRRSDIGRETVQRDTVQRETLQYNQQVKSNMNAAISIVNANQQQQQAQLQQNQQRQNQSLTVPIGNGDSDVEQIEHWQQQIDQHQLCEQEQQQQNLNQQFQHHFQQQMQYRNSQEFLEAMRNHQEQHGNNHFCNRINEWQGSEQSPTEHIAAVQLQQQQQQQISPTGTNNSNISANQIQQQPVSLNQQLQYQLPLAPIPSPRAIQCQNQDSNTDAINNVQSMQTSDNINENEQEERSPRTRNLIKRLVSRNSRLHQTLLFEGQPGIPAMLVMMTFLLTTVCMVLCVNLSTVMRPSIRNGPYQWFFETSISDYLGEVYYVSVPMLSVVSILLVALGVIRHYPIQFEGQNLQHWQGVLHQFMSRRNKWMLYLSIVPPLALLGLTIVTNGAGRVSKKSYPLQSGIVHAVFMIICFFGFVVYNFLHSVLLLRDVRKMYKVFGLRGADGKSKREKKDKDNKVQQGEGVTVTASNQQEPSEEQPISSADELETGNATTIIQSQQQATITTTQYHTAEINNDKQILSKAERQQNDQLKQKLKALYGVSILGLFFNICLLASLFFLFLGDFNKNVLKVNIDQKHHMFFMIWEWIAVIFIGLYQATLVGLYFYPNNVQVHAAANTQNNRNNSGANFNCGSARISQQQRLWQRTRFIQYQNHNHSQIQQQRRQRQEPQQDALEAEHAQTQPQPTQIGRPQLEDDNMGSLSLTLNQRQQRCVSFRQGNVVDQDQQQNEPQDGA